MGFIRQWLVRTMSNEETERVVTRSSSPAEMEFGEGLGCYRDVPPPAAYTDTMKGDPLEFSVTESCAQTPQY
jgi:hypothetical protein